VRVLEPPDTHFVNAAQGWLDLSNPREAREELKRVSTAAGNLPEVIEVRWQICALEQDWTSALALARELIRRAPQQPGGWLNQSYSLHEMKRTQEAWDFLRPLVKRFPKNCTVAYNLACYACQLGDLQEAKEWFHRALDLRGKEEIKKMGLHDADLLPLREYIQAL